MTTLVLFLALAPLMACALHRDMRRADARRRTRLILGNLRTELEEIQRKIGEALMPAMRDTAQAAAKVVEAFARIGREGESA